MNDTNLKEAFRLVVDRCRMEPSVYEFSKDFISLCGEFNHNADAMYAAIGESEAIRHIIDHVDRLIDKIDEMSGIVLYLFASIGAELNDNEED